MATHYLIDPFTSTLSILDVTTSDSGEVDTTGALSVLIPDGVAIHGSPTDMLALQDAKADGLLAYYAGFSSIIFDDCFTSADVDTAQSNGVQLAGGLVNHCLYDGGVLTTTSIALGSTPSQVVVVWEAYSFANNDPADGRFARVLQEGDSNLFSCDIAFDGLGSYSALSGAVTNIAPADQGSNIVLTFTNTSGSRLYLGSWAVIY